MPVTITKSPTTKVAKPVVATVDKVHPDGAETEKNEHLGWVEGAATLAEVKVSMGMTKKIGDFEFLRFDVHVTVPCENNPGAMQESFEFGKKWVEERIDLIASEVNDQLQ